MLGVGETCTVSRRGCEAAVASLILGPVGDGFANTQSLVGDGI